MSKPVVRLCRRQQHLELLWIVTLKDALASPSSFDHAACTVFAPQLISPLFRPAILVSIVSHSRLTHASEAQKSCFTVVISLDLGLKVIIMIGETQGAEHKIMRRKVEVRDHYRWYISMWTHPCSGHRARVTSALTRISDMPGLPGIATATFSVCQSQ